MSRWIVEGLRGGKKTTAYPSQPETAAGVSPGMPDPDPSVNPAEPEDRGSAIDHDLAAGICPVRALVEEDGKLAIRRERCVHCMRCRHAETQVKWSRDYEWARRVSPVGAATDTALKPLPAAFKRSIYIRVVDAGACAACMREIALLGQPHYNMHRLGFFVTPTPRKADVLLVAGPVTDHMRAPLERVYAAMPEPRRVIAVGACALSGGVFGPSFASGCGVNQVLPVAVAVPGCPPPPLAILHALIGISGQVDLLLDNSLVNPGVNPGAGS